MLIEHLADVVAIGHLVWVFSVVVGFVWTLVALFAHYKLLDCFWIRTIHLVFVILIALLPRFGMNCPLSVIELNLRLHSGSAFEESFALHYLQKFVYEGIGPAFVEISTLIMFLGTLAAYLYRPPRRTSRLAKV